MMVVSSPIIINKHQYKQTNGVKRMRKTILITGSTDGIGKLVANRFAQDGHDVYLHGRNPDKLATTIEEIQSASGNANVSGFIADMSDLAAVRSLAAEVSAKLSGLDVLINNAGIFTTSSAQTESGLDMRMVVNYLAPYLLTEALQPLLKQRDNPRVINLSSAAQSPVALDVLRGERQAEAQAVYAQSKLALTMWSMALARQQPDMTVIAVNPGSLLNTNMANEAYGQHWSSADKGSDILYDLALHPDYQSASGKYFDNDKGNPKGDFGDAHPDAYDEAAITNLLRETERLIADYR